MTTTGLVPEQASYDELKFTVLTILPTLPALVMEAFGRRLEELGVFDVQWRLTRQIAVECGRFGNDKCVLFGGEGVWVGKDFDAFQKQVFLSGSEYSGCWLAGFSPGWMGNDRWVFNFSLAVPTI